MSPESVGTAALFIRKGVRWIPFRDFTLPTNWNPAKFQPIIDTRSGGPISIGAGVRTSKWSHGGVMAARLWALAKNSKTSVSGCSSVCCDLKWNVFISQFSSGSDVCSSCVSRLSNCCCCCPKRSTYSIKTNHITI